MVLNYRGMPDGTQELHPFPEEKMAEALVRIPGVMFAVDSHAKYYMIARVGHEIFKHVKPGTPVTVTELDRTGDDRKFRISYETDSEGESQNSV